MTGCKIRQCSSSKGIVGKNLQRKPLFEHQPECARAAGFAPFHSIGTGSVLKEFLNQTVPPIGSLPACLTLNEALGAFAMPIRPCSCFKLFKCTAIHFWWWARTIEYSPLTFDRLCKIAKQ